ncbi:MAG TPA: hypothetical protein VND91_02415 [Candidatus Saccharimonadia bacterium]|nr:hypothetical protein [Candidatus Saccharimonadia bacterium]
MNPCTWKCSLLVIALAAALSSCSRDATRSDTAYDDRDEKVEPMPAPRAAPVAAPAPKRAPASPASPATPADSDDELVGVEACDDYLENYRSCHRVLGMYPADTLESRYQKLRSELVARSLDSAARDGLKAQCESLADDMSTALDGRDCPDDTTVAGEASLEDAIDDDEPDSP